MIALSGPNIHTERERGIIERERKERLLQRVGYVLRHDSRRYTNVLSVGADISERTIDTMGLNVLREMLIHTKRNQINQLIHKLEEDILRITNN